MVTRAFWGKKTPYEKKLIQKKLLNLQRKPSYCNHFLNVVYPAATLFCLVTETHIITRRTA